METHVQRVRRETIEERNIELIARLVHYKGMSPDVVADLLGITVDEVRSCAETASLSA